MLSVTGLRLQTYMPLRVLLDGLPGGALVAMSSRKLKVARKEQSCKEVHLARCPKTGGDESLEER